MEIKYAQLSALVLYTNIGISLSAKGDSIGTFVALTVIYCSISVLIQYGGRKMYLS